MSGNSFGVAASDHYTCTGNTANLNTHLPMERIEKHLFFVKALNEKTDVVIRAARVTIEQKFAPYYRTFVLIDRAMSREDLNKIEDLATEHALNTNPFRAGSNVTSITFTDMDEAPRS